METPDKEKDKNSKKSESILESLVETVMCPVCLETLRSEMAVCVNGHAICRECQGCQLSCPTCRADFVQGEHKQIMIVRQVVEVISSACKFKGCGYLAVPGDDHEARCVFRPLNCSFVDCEWKGPLVEWVPHFKTTHHENLSTVIEEMFGSLCC